MRELKDMSYVVAKCYGEKGKLLTYDALEELASSLTLAEFVEKLRPTAYGPYMAALPKAYTPTSVELALRRSLVELHFDLAMKSEHPDIVRAYYMKHIASNLKTVLKMKALGKSQDEITGILDMRAEELVGRRDILVRALASKDLKEAVGMLSGTKFGDMAAMAAGLYEKERDLTVFDVTMDKTYLSEVLRAYRRLPSIWRKMIRQIVAADIDGYNVTSILRSKLWGLTPHEARNFLLGAAINTPTEFLEMMLEADSIQDALAVLEETVYKDFIPKEAARDASIIRHLEGSFERLSLKRAREAFLKDIFGISVVVSLLKLKELEVRSLSIIAAGVYAGVGAKKILQSVFTVR